MVNVNLHSKPEWYLKLNPSGQVPLLHFDDGRVMPESLSNSEYLDTTYADKNQLSPRDPGRNAEHKLFVERFSKFIGSYYKALSAGGGESIDQLKDALKSLDSSLPNNGGLLGGYIRQTNSRRFVRSKINYAIMIIF